MSGYEWGRFFGRITDRAMAHPAPGEVTPDELDTLADEAFVIREVTRTTIVDALRSAAAAIRERDATIAALLAVPRGVLLSYGDMASNIERDTVNTIARRMAVVVEGER